MATYKVLQDIEAEDKFLGPLTLKQFIFASIAVVCLYLGFYSMTRGAPIMLAFLLPPAVFFIVMAWPWSKVQSTETWLLAKLRFYFKPHRRIWDQSGMKELVTITVPKKIEHHLTNGLSEMEIKSRLQALANTIDSRGWAIKNVNVNLFSQPSYATNTDSDRLIDPSSLPQEVATADVGVMDDMMDENNNPTAQHLQQMITASTQTHRNQVVARMNPQAAAQSKGQNPPADYWFMSQSQPTRLPAGFTTTKSQVILPGQQAEPSTKHTSADETALAEKIRHQKHKGDPAYGHMRTLQPLRQQKKHKSIDHGDNREDKTSRPPSDPAILELASNDDLNVATIARQAEKTRKKEPPEDEVVISLR